MTAIIEFKNISGDGELILKNWITEMVNDKDIENESMLRYADSVRFEQ